MSTLITYLAGVITVPLVFAGITGWWTFQDWLAARRYQRAWDKFGAEFDRLPRRELALYQALWAEAPWDYAHVCDDRSRYFKMRWKYGQTKEV